MRRSRSDENAVKADDDAAKRAKGSWADGLPSKPQGKKGKKSSRKRARAKKDSGFMATALLPINENASGSCLEITKDESQLVHKAALRAAMENSKPPADGEFELSSSSCMHSPESPKALAERAVIWSNAAFCSELQSQSQVFEMEMATSSLQKEENGSACNGVTDQVAKRETYLTDTTASDEPVEAKTSDCIEDQKASLHQKEVKTVVFEDDEVDHLEKEIENEIAHLTRRLAELRAKREAKHKIQERANRALSCPPTPLLATLQEITNNGDRSKSRGKGRMVSAKFLEWQTKSPDLESKVLEKRISFRETSATTTSSQGIPGFATSTSHSTPGTAVVTPTHGRPLTEAEGPLKSGFRAPRNKVIEKLQGSPGLKCLARPPTALRSSYRCSLDGNFIEQIRNLSLSPATSNISESSKKFDWTKSLRSGIASVEKRSQLDDTHKEKAATGKGTPEAQLLVDLKESKASKISPSVTRKVRNVASRYSESPVQEATRKRSLDTPSQASPDGGATATNQSSHKKRVSLDQQQQKQKQKDTAETSLPRKPGPGAAAKSGLSRLRPRNLTSKQTTVTTPTKKDGLENERKKLPGLVINREMEFSPRDSGCVKRASQREGNKCFFSTE